MRVMLHLLPASFPAAQLERIQTLAAGPLAPAPLPPSPLPHSSASVVNPTTGWLYLSDYESEAPAMSDFDYEAGPATYPFPQLLDLAGSTSATIDTASSIEGALQALTAADGVFTYAGVWQCRGGRAVGNKRNAGYEGSAVQHGLQPP